LVWKGFPDARGYTVDARNPDSVSFPSRATVKQVQIDWAGSPRWKMPLPQLPANAGPADVGREIRLEARKPATPGARDWGLVGTVTHGLPGPLTEVVIAVVRRQTPLYKALPGSLLAEAAIFKLVGDWKPGEPLDLDAKTQPGDSKLTVGDYLKGLVPPDSRGRMGDPLGSRSTKSTADDRLTALAFFSLLDPPQTNNSSDDHSLVRRESTQSWDITRWFTQPCVIIIGHLREEETPIPVLVDGKPLATRGRTVVRWVYPLRPDPPPFRPQAPSDPQPASPDPAAGPNG
jgi:hypothetical protein